MRPTAAFTIVALGAAAFGWSMAGASAQSTDGNRGFDRGAAAYAQTSSNAKRARTRVRVTPRCLYRTVSLPYPPPYECEYPGLGFVRECTTRLVKEARPSGMVIVPQTRCWWQRG